MYMSICNVYVWEGRWVVCRHKNENTVHITCHLSDTVMQQNEASHIILRQRTVIVRGTQS